MVEKFVTSSRNVLDFARYQRERNAAGKHARDFGAAVPALRRGAARRRARG